MHGYYWVPCSYSDRSAEAGRGWETWEMHSSLSFPHRVTTLPHHTYKSARRLWAQVGLAGPSSAQGLTELSSHLLPPSPCGCGESVFSRWEVEVPTTCWLSAGGCSQPLDPAGVPCHAARHPKSQQQGVTGHQSPTVC